MSSTVKPDFKLLFQSFPGLVMILQPDCIIADASDAYLCATLTTRENVVGRHLFDVFPDNPDDERADGVAKLSASIEQVKATGKPHVMAIQKYDVRRPDSVFEEKYWLPVNTPVFNENNELVYIIHTAEDVTQQRKSEEKFHDLLDAAPDATVIVDHKGIIQMVNKEAQSLFGYEKSEMIGQPVEMLVPDGFKEGHSTHRDKYLHAQHVRPMNAVNGLSGIKKDGSVFPAEINLSPIFTETGLLVSATVKDMTDRKRTMAQLELLSQQINQSNDAIYTVDTELRILTWNLGAEKLYGYTQEDAIGKESLSLLGSEISGHEINEIKKVLETKDYWTSELKKRTKAGKTIYVISSVSAIKDEAGKITGYVVVNIDVTEQRRLRTQVEHLASMVEQSSEAIISRDMDNKLNSWNNGAVELFGFSKEEAIGRTAANLGIIRFTAEELLEVQNDLAEKGSWKSEKCYYRKDGSTFIGAVTANAVKDERGNLNSVVFIIKDISLRKQMEEHLKRSNEELERKVQERTLEIKRSEAKYRYLFENNPLPMWVLDIETLRFLDVNGRTLQQYGYSREEFLQMTAMDIRPESEKERYKALDHTFDLNSTNSGKGIWKHLKKDGTEIEVDIIAHPILFEGKPAKLILSNDVTEKMKAEEKLTASEKRFRTLIENSYDIITLLDESFHVLYRSPSAIRVTGRTDAEVIGEDGSKRVHPDDMPMIRVGLKELLSAPGNSVNTLFRYQHVDGHYLWMEGTARNLLHEPHVNAIVFNYRDVTERISEEKLIEQMAQLQTLSDNLPGVMFYQISGDNFENRHFTYVSNGVKNFTGRTAAEVIRDPSILYNLIHKEDMPRLIEAEMISYQNMSVFNEEVRCITAGGEIKWLNIISTPRMLSNGQCVWDGFHMDITVRKNAEEVLQNSFMEKQAVAERMSTILNALPANIALLDSEGFIVEVNDAWKSFADNNGFMGSNYGIGDNYLTISAGSCNKEEADGKIVTYGIKAVLENRRDEFIYEYPCHSPSEQRWFRMVVTPLKGKEHAGAVVMHVDISEIRRLEQERMESKQEEQKRITEAMLEGQENERSAVALELHDNVSQILVGAKLLLHRIKPVSERENEVLHSCMSSIQKAIDENRKITHELVVPDFDGHHFNDQLLSLTNRMLKAANLDVFVDMNSFNEDLLSNQQKLAVYRILQEQCTNIVKHAEARLVNIILTTENNHFSMSITDDGNGMEAGISYNGIGLRNMSSRLNVLNGTLRFETQPGSGFTLHVNMPLSAFEDAMIS